ncbi:hypothetical protein [Nocardioides nanhaiensis]|uniref:Uncharacterized protein n=1 Tax=Nocardioides nanhaiensis TaxID=1476871 RepID=A0ABP8VQG6_9ACTN
MTNSPMTNSLEMRWVTTTDQSGRPSLEMRWIDTSVTAEAAVLVDRAA